MNMKLKTQAQNSTTYSLINSELYETISVWDIAKCKCNRKLWISPQPLSVTMKLGSNAQSAMIYILINVEPYKTVSARDIEPSPYEFQKFPKKSLYRKSAF